MHSYLKEILQQKQFEVSRLKNQLEDQPDHMIHHIMSGKQTRQSHK